MQYEEKLKRAAYYFAGVLGCENPDEAERWIRTCGTGNLRAMNDVSNRARAKWSAPSYRRGFERGAMVGGAMVGLIALALTGILGCEPASLEACPVAPACVPGDVLRLEGDDGARASWKCSAGEWQGGWHGEGERQP